MPVKFRGNLRSKQNGVANVNVDGSVRPNNPPEGKTPCCNLKNGGAFCGL